MTPSRTIVPDVLLDLPGSSWPPARDGQPSGRSRVGSWSVDRELVGASIPGQIVVRTGLSVGTASVTIRQEVKGRALAPWAVSQSRRVIAGNPAKIVVALPSPDGDINLGDWFVHPTSGALTSAEVSVQLIEASSALRRSPNVVRSPGGSSLTSSPYWVLQGLASSAGFYASRPLETGQNSLLRVPFQGSIEPDYGQLRRSSDVPTQAGTFIRANNPSTGYALQTPVSLTYWVEGVTTPSGSIVVDEESPNLLPPPTGSTYFAADVVCGTGTTDVDLLLMFGEGEGIDSLVFPAYIALRKTAAGEGTIDFTCGQGHGSALGTVAAPVTTPGDVVTLVVQYEVLDGYTDAPFPVTGINSMRVRANFGSGWSAWFTHTPGVTSWSNNYSVRLTLGEWGFGGPTQALSNVEFTSSDPSTRRLGAFTPTAQIDWQEGTALGWFPGSLDKWSALQQFAEAWLMGAWLDLSGTLQIRDRYYLSGVGRTPEVVDVERLANDVAWTVDPTEDVDRLEVTYRPITQVPSTDGNNPILWQSTEALYVAPNSSLVVMAELPDPSPVSHTWVQVGVGTLPPYLTSQFSAIANSTGTGTVSPGGWVDVVSTSESTGRVRIEVTNLNTYGIYLVDAAGKPCLILRASTNYTLSQATPVVLERGATSEAAINTATVDLGTYVPEWSDASQIASFLWARVARTTWTVEGMQMPVNWRRDLADYLLLEYPEQDLSARALVTKVALSGGPGTANQTVNLSLLPNRWLDLDALWGNPWVNPETGTTSPAWKWREFDLYWNDGQQLIQRGRDDRFDITATGPLSVGDPVWSPDGEIFGMTSSGAGTITLLPQWAGTVGEGGYSVIGATDTFDMSADVWIPAGATALTFRFWLSGFPDYAPSSPVFTLGTVGAVPADGRWHTITKTGMVLPVGPDPLVRVTTIFDWTAPSAGHYVQMRNMRLVRNPGTVTPGGTWDDFDSEPMRRD